MSAVNVGLFCHMCGSKDLEDVGGHYKCKVCNNGIPKERGRL